MSAQTTQQLVKQISTKVNESTQTGRTAVLLCSPQIRNAVRRMIEGALPQVAVLAYNEIVSDVSVEAIGLIGMNG